MPIYEYQCPSCDHKFELRRPMAEAAALADCPRCHNGARRTLSVFASIVKGAAAPAPVPSAACSSCSAFASGACSSPN